MVYHTCERTVREKGLLINNSNYVFVGLADGTCVLNRYNMSIPISDGVNFYRFLSQLRHLRNVKPHLLSIYREA